MDQENLADDYISAWNRRDVDRLLELMHKGASIYDAYLRETCVGRDLAQYLQDRLDDEEYWYQRIGDVIAVDRGVVFRYSAHEGSEPTIGPLVFNGAEVFIIRDNKILTVSDFYCDPDPLALKEIANLAARRHGLPRYARSGLGVLKVARYRNRLSNLIDHRKVYLDPELTLSQLADMVGCTVDHLAQVIITEFGTSFHDLLNHNRVKTARDLLSEESYDPNRVFRVADQVGFQSFEEFSNAFREMYGVTPELFYRHETNSSKPDD